MKRKLKAFSLIEVVIALGIFVFCIVGIVGLLPIASNSVKSVSIETTANNIAESISGFWQVAPLLATSSANFTMGNFSIGNGTQTINYTISGTEASSASDAALRLNYAANSLGAANPNTFTVNLTFTWPPNATGNITTTRTFNYIFTK